jgi:hypothetical protein
MKSSDKRMAADRCAFLAFTAIVNQLEEAWICFFPILPIMYFNQYMPTITKRSNTRVMNKYYLSLIDKGIWQCIKQIWTHCFPVVTMS